MAEFRVWLPEEGDTESVDATTVQADSPREAAESLGDDLGDGEWIVVAVRAPDGSLTEWRVSAFLLVDRMAGERVPVEFVSTRYHRG